MRSRLGRGVVTAEQVDNHSLATQERECRAYCEREGFEIDRIFREEGESAKTVDRTQLGELPNHCSLNAKRRGIGVLVVYRVDRFARQVADHHAIRAALGRYGVFVRAVAETFDESPAGKLLENVMAAGAVPQ